MCTIKLKDIIIPSRTYPEAGSVLYDMIVDNLECDRIVLDMDGVDSLPSMFLNVSIGKFIDTYGVVLLKQKISFAHIPASQAARIVEYIKKIS